MVNKKKLNLQFGAEIKELIVESQSQHFKAISGTVYSFTEYTKNPTLVKLMTQGFQYIQSINSNDRAKNKTNDSIRFGVRTFLNWIEETDYQGTLNSNLLLEFKKHLSTRNSWTAYSAYTVVARITQKLIEKGILNKFIIPKNIPLQQAKNASKAGNTIATILEQSKIELSIDDINEKTLSLIVDTSWEETFKLFSLLENGRFLCENLTKEYIPYKKGMTRQEALNAIIKNLYIEFKGLPTEYSFANKLHGYPNKNFTKLIGTYIYANRHNNWGITGYEINKYLNPTKELVGLLSILLCAAQINPESAIYLKKDCLIEDTNPELMRLIWVKYRAGGEQLSIPFPKGKHANAKTIPNVIKLYANSTMHFRDNAPEKVKDLLFIWKNHQGGEKSAIQHPRSSSHDLIKDALNLIKNNLQAKNDNNPISNLAISLCDSLTLNIIRATAINVSSKRLDRDISNVALMDGRKTEQPLTEHYLRNKSTSDAFDSKIRESQALMYDWVNSKPIVIQPNENELIEKLHISEENAKKIINDEFNNGYGASLIHENVIIIDSPLNALRIIQWLEKIEENKNKVINSNPERWNSVYLPQQKLFNEALSLMSKKTKSEALEMHKEITLPFPEVL